MTSPQYDIKNYAGAVVASVLPMESNGVGNMSVPRDIVDIEFASSVTNSKDAVIVTGSVSARFVQGQQFSIINSTYSGTYVVDDGSSSPGAVVAIERNNQTYIPVAGGITLAQFPIVGVETGAGGKFHLTGLTNGQFTFLPGLSFSVTGNSLPAANQGYTIVSAETSGIYSIVSVTPASQKVTLAGNVVRFFQLGDQINVRGLLVGNGDGTYTVSTTSLVNGNTEVVLDNSTLLPADASSTSVSIVSRTTPITYVTVQETIPVGAGTNGTANVLAPVVLTLTAPTTITATASPTVSTVVYTVSGNYTGPLQVGTPFIVKKAIVGGVSTDIRTTVANIAYVGPTTSYPQGVTQIATTFINSAGTLPEVVTNGFSRLVFPASAAPYGQLQYSTGADTSLSLVGRGVATFNPATSWGQALEENLVHIMENFAGALPPAAPLQGQMWFDTAFPALRVLSDTPYTILTVVPGTKTFTIDCAASSLGTVGATLYVYGNTAYATPHAFTVASISDATTAGTSSGHTTTVVVNEVVSVTASTSNPSTAVPFGKVIPKIALHAAAVTNMALDGDILMGGNRVKNIGDAVAPGDAVSQGYGDTRYVNTTGDTMSGTLVLSGSPANPLEAATKQYVDDHVNGIVWITPILDPNLFNDSLSTPPVVAAGDTLTTYHRTYIVKSAGTGAWAGFDGHAMYYDGTNWKSVLGRAVQVGDRFGVFIEPDDDDTLSTPTAGGLAGLAGKIVTVASLAPITYTSYTPTEPDAVSVKGTVTGSSPHFGHSYTFRGTWGTGSYGTNYRWIEFSGPQMLVDGAGLRYTANILNVGAGTGITVGTDTVSLDTTYADGRYVTKAASSTLGSAVNVTFVGGGEVLGLPTTPTTPGSAASKSYVDTVVGTKSTDTTVVHIAGTETITGAKTFTNTHTVTADGTHTNLVISSTAYTITGTPVTTGTGTTLSLAAGQNTGGVGGVVSIAGGQGSTTGGNVTITSGAGSSAANAGSITLTAGNGSLSISASGVLSVGGSAPTASRQALVSDPTNPTTASQKWVTVGTRVATAPATAAAAGSAGDWFSDDSFFYVYGATGWRRVAVSTF